MASLFTGLLPPAHRTVGRRSVLPEDATTLAEILAVHGYEGMGLVRNPNVGRAFGFAQGFTRFRSEDRERDETMLDRVRLWLDERQGGGGAVLPLPARDRPPRTLRPRAGVRGDVRGRRRARALPDRPLPAGVEPRRGGARAGDRRRAFAAVRRRGGPERPRLRRVARRTGGARPGRGHGGDLSLRPRRGVRGARALGARPVALRGGAAGPAGHAPARGAAAARGESRRSTSTSCRRCSPTWVSRRRPPTDATCWRLVAAATHPWTSTPTSTWTATGPPP